MLPPFRRRGRIVPSIRTPPESRDLPPPSPPPENTLTLNDIFTIASPPSPNDVENIYLTPLDPPVNDNLDIIPTLPSSPSPSDLEKLSQLVNDHNLVGPGHDIMLRPFVCDYPSCNKAFARKSDLARHYRIHTGDRPFVCDLKGCGKSFIQRSALTVHIRTHTGEKPHVCETCEKPFADSSSLARHRRIHTGTRPYACRQLGCNKSFARRNTFLKHFKRQHPDIPAPSTNTHRHTVHYPVQPRGYLAPGPPGPDGQPQYYVRTGSSGESIHPHGNAASHPPEGAAYPYGGGHPGTLHGQPHFVFPGDRGVGLGGGLHKRRRSIGSRVRGGSGYLRTPNHQQESFTSITSLGSVGESTSNVQTVHTPLSATSSFAHSEAGGNSVSGFTSPSTPFTGNGMFKQDHHLTSIGRSASGPVGLELSPFNGSTLFTQSSNIPAPPQGMVWFKTEHSSRSVSAPMARYHGQPYTSAPFGGVGGGFMPGQLALPPSHNQHLVPSYYQPPHWSHTSETNAGGNEAHVDAEEREDTPEPLVDINSVPQFSFHPPPASDTSLNGPFSAVDDQHFNPLTHGPPQISATSPQPARLHSAPPLLHRFHSQPSIPTMSSWTIDHRCQVSPGYGDASSVGAEAQGREDQVLEDLERQMIRRDVSVEPAEGTLVQNPSENLGEQAPIHHWGAPVEYPQPPREANQRTPFSSGASSTSTSTTLVGPAEGSTHTPHPSEGLPPIAVLSQHPTNPMMLTPISQEGFYPTPLTPWSAMSHDGFKSYDGGFQPSFAQYPLGSPAVICRNPNQTLYHSDSSDTSMHQEIHNITLTTPPKGPSSQEKQDGVNQVGLGIANVHFQDRSDAIAQDPQFITPVKTDLESMRMDVKMERGEGSDDSGDDEEELDAGAGEDSDDDFVPGSRKKSMKRKSLKSSRGKGWSSRSKRKV